MLKGISSEAVKPFTFRS